jgi:hypothetical protein
MNRVLRYRMTANGLEFEVDRDDRYGADVPPDYPLDELNLDVYEDTWFYLRLSSQREWYWSRDFDAVTTKKDNKRYYGKIEYQLQDQSWVEWDGNGPKPWQSKRIRFLASKNEDGVDPIHEFSLNIDLILTGGRRLPISLDPDIENPKPQLAVPIGGPKPGLLQAR